VHEPLSDWLDSFGRRHIWLMALLTFALAAAATIALLSEKTATGVLYGGF
jgi:hypothetical protein